MEAWKVCLVSYSSRRTNVHVHASKENARAIPIEKQKMQEPLDCTYNSQLLQSLPRYPIPALVVERVFRPIRLLLCTTSGLDPINLAQNIQEGEGRITLSTR